MRLTVPCAGWCVSVRRLTNEAVRAYHREYYRPDNLCIIITGQVRCHLITRGHTPTCSSI